jgi:DsbC/DsbD-like thiol-disulfide interchange protein
MKTCLVLKNRMRLLAVAAVATLPLAGTSDHADAASSAWAETEGGRMRLTALPPDSGGIIRAVLDVDLMPGWKTYWRDPGEAGIPPKVEFAGSANVRGFHLSFPPPERIDDGYSVFAGYTEPVAFPIAIEQDRPGGDSRLKADVFLGICSKICVPFQAEFVVDVDGGSEPNGYERFLVDNAFDALPEAASEDFNAGNPSVDEDGKTFRFDVTVPDGPENADVFVSGPAGWYFSVPRPVADDEPGRFRVSVVASPGDAVLSGTEFRLLVVSGRRSMETGLKIP